MTRDPEPTSETTYLSGPMTGHARGNIEAFREAADRMRARGYKVVSPVELDGERGIDPEESGDLPRDVRAIALAEDIRLVSDPLVHSLTMLEGWRESEGATIEARVAWALDKPVREYPSLKAVPPEAILAEQPAHDVRTFDTGATRDTDEGKPDYEGYLSPLVVAAYGRYMLRHSTQPDGSKRASDNWQRGIPRDAYMKSGWRHLIEWWTLHRGEPEPDPAELEEAVCALLFNASGYLHESLKNAPAT